MTALILRATPLAEMVALKLQALGRRILRALDAFGEARARNAVPEWQLRKVQREMARCRQLMLAERAAPSDR
jgi:hypothetical protein